MDAFLSNHWLVSDKCQHGFSTLSEAECAREKNVLLYHSQCDRNTTKRHAKM